MASTLYFPLRTSVELFGDRRTPDAITRAKQAAVLYDDLLFDVGLLEVHVLDAGSWMWWTPPHQLSDERLEGTRDPIAPGTPISFGAAVQPGPGIPAPGPGRTILQGKVLLDYAAEFHTGILDELARFEPDWVHLLETGGTDTPNVPKLRELVNALNFRDLRDHDLMADRTNWERSWIYKAFNHDSVIATSLGAGFNVTPVFEPLLNRNGGRPDLAGAHALEVQVPNVGALPWEAIVEFRNHPGNEQARQKLREFEETAAASEPRDAEEFFLRMNQEMARASQQAFAEFMPKMPETVAKEVGKTLVALIPVVGPFIEKGATAAEMVAQTLSGRRSWLAALMELRSWS